MQFNFTKHDLEFVFDAKTSRGQLLSKPSYIINYIDEEGEFVLEVSLIPGLSIDEVTTLEETLKNLTHNPERFLDSDFDNLPALNFAKDQLLLIKSILNKSFDTDFLQGKKSLAINGLIWMGDLEFMKVQFKNKIEENFKCIKIKVGSLDFPTELKFIESIRNSFGYGFELRLDANGAFGTKDVYQKLDKLSRYDIHSIEQPIAPHQIKELEKLCSLTPIPIALDEELIGKNLEEIEQLLSLSKPQYVILKPSLLGGFFKCDKIIALATNLKIGWWATSALESNIGLDDIALWVSKYNPALPQGLGTGKLFKYNFKSNLSLKGDQLWYNKV